MYIIENTHKHRSNLQYTAVIFLIRKSRTLASRIIDQGRLIFFSQKCAMVGPYSHRVDYFNLVKICYGRLLAPGRLMALLLFHLELSFLWKSSIMARKVLMGEYWKILLVISFLVNWITVNKVYLPHFFNSMVNYLHLVDY